MEPGTPHLPASRARLWRTAWYVVIAALLGVTFVPISCGLGYVLALIFAREWNIARTHPLVLVITLAVSLPLSFFGLFEGARNSFAKKPVYPHVVAWAVGVPAVCIGCLALFTDVAYGASMLLCAGAGAWGMLRGATRGARNASMRIGLGDLCAHCGYDLSATPEHQICPECGGTFRFDSARIG